MQPLIGDICNLVAGGEYGKPLLAVTGAAPVDRIRAARVPCVLRPVQIIDSGDAQCRDGLWLVSRPEVLKSLTEALRSSHVKLSAMPHCDRCCAGCSATA